MTRTSGRSTSRRSETSEDGPCTVHDRAWVAGRVHGQAASRAERPPRGQDGLGLFRKRDHLVVAEPEAHRWGIVGEGSLTRIAGSRLAGDEDEHLAGVVVAEPHLADLPLGPAGPRVVGSRLGGALRSLDLLCLHHLVNTDEEGLELRLLAAQGERPPRPRGEEKKPPLAPPA